MNSGFLKHLSGTCFLLLAFCFLPAQASATYPFTITLESSGSPQTIAAGTNGVALARYRLSADGGEVFSVSALALERRGASGLEACRLIAPGRSVKVPDSAEGRVVVSFAPPLEMRGHALVTLRCDIPLNQVGESFSWGLALTAPEVVIYEGVEVLVPATVLARRPDGKPGVNGQIFAVVPPNTSLNAAVLTALAPRDASESGVAPGTLIRTEVRIINDGATPWSAGRYALAPDPSTDAPLWYQAPHSEDVLDTAVAPGEAVSLSLDLTAPNDPRRHRLGWVLRAFKDEDGGGVDKMIQTSSSVRLTVSAPPPRESVFTRLERFTEGLFAPFVSTPSDSGSAGDDSGDTEGGEVENGAPLRLGNSRQSQDGEIGADSLSPAPPASAERSLVTPPIFSLSVPEEPISATVQDGSEGENSVDQTSEYVVAKETPEGETAVVVTEETGGVLDPIEAVKAILEKILASVGPRKVDYPALKADAERISEQLSAMALADKNDILSKTPIVITFPGGSATLEFAEDSFLSDVRIEINVKDPEEISVILAEHPLPEGWGVLGQVLLGEFRVYPYDQTNTALLAHPIKATLAFEDSEFSGFSWERESIGVYRLAENGAWRRVSGSAVLVYSKNSIVVTALPNIDELGVLALVGKFSPPPTPQEAALQTSIVSEIGIGPSPMRAAVCSYFQFFGWPPAGACRSR